ncbi:B461 [Biomphalaria pfeifferi]|uniref:B461 n=1 Tax=Biomphalaria pfeifferi TaxID=112525 RepID=A0AAD8EU42_BIOPF|nr:B461 [Biomphalaria pfeifferi]
MLRQAVEYGYDEGYRAGLADREDDWDYDYQSAYGYEDASYGYDGYYVDYNEYQYYFREGFRRGYEDGYYSRSRYGRYDNGNYSILSTILQGIFSAILFND